MISCSSHVFQQLVNSCALGPRGRSGVKRTKELLYRDVACYLVNLNGSVEIGHLEYRFLNRHPKLGNRPGGKAAHTKTRHRDFCMSGTSISFVRNDTTFGRKDTTKCVLLIQICWITRNPRAHFAKEIDSFIYKFKY